MTTANWIQLDRNFQLENAGDCVAELQTPAKWEALRELPIVALLAEAGTGKTTELKIQQQLLIDRGEYVFHGDVQLIASTGELAFGISIEQWRQSEASAYFFLDAADVAQIDSVNSLPNALSKTLSIIGKNSAHIIIACRPSEWSSQLAAGLFELCNPPGKEAIHPFQKTLRSLGLRAIPSYSLDSLNIVQREQFLTWLTKDKGVALDLLRRLSEANTLWMARSGLTNGAIGR